MILKLALPIVLAVCAQVAMAQNATDISNGLGFANSIAPTSPSQVINPGSVNSTAWGNQSSTPTSVPTGLGGFSAPNTDSSIYSSAQTSSLSALGDQAMINCASYTPGSDPYQNQYCSAVNFLNNQCMQPTTGESSVLGNVGTTQGSTSNCAGTYGAGQSQFGYSNQITDSDPAFSAISSLGTTAPNTLTQTCTPQTVVTQPAQYATDICVVSQQTDDNSCSQTMSATVTQTLSAPNVTLVCPAGYTLAGEECLSTTSATPVCPDGYAMQSDGTCVSTSTQAAIGSCPSPDFDSNTGGFSFIPVPKAGDCAVSHIEPWTCASSIDGQPLVATAMGEGAFDKPEPELVCYYPQIETCPNGFSYNGSECINTASTPVTYSCPTGSLQGQTCVTTTTSSTSYSCPTGQNLNGSNQCIKQTVTTSWTDACGLYEQSAGSTLPTPTQ